MLFMKKNLTKGMVALCVCALFASCSKDAGFEAPNQIELAKNQYAANFIKQYGEINPNQNWDFTSSSASQARTRANESFSDEMEHEAYNFFSFVDFDFDAIKGLLNNNSYSGTIKKTSWFHTTTYKINGTATVKTWNQNFQVKLTPTYAHSNYEVNDNRYFHIAFNYNNNEQEMIANIKVKGFGTHHWYDAKSGTLIHHTSRAINTTSAVGGTWFTYYTKADGVGVERFKVKNITNYREIKINVTGQDERTYWGFDCDGDEDYSDVICLVRDFKNPDPIKKRYMIEDLGTTGDFDFNDIVVDFEDDLMGNQKAIIRAMGGTLDFTLNVNGQAVWTKSINGPKLAEPVQVIDMVNTKPEIAFNKVIDQFKVTGWNPTANNISVTVTYKDETSETGSTIYTIPFPKVGQVPMMFATDVLVPWMEEWLNFPKWWLEQQGSDEDFMTE